MEKIIIRWGNSASFLQFVCNVRTDNLDSRYFGAEGDTWPRGGSAVSVPPRADFDFCDFIPQDGSDWNPLPVSFKHNTRQVTDNVRSCAEIALKKLVLVCDTHGPCSVCETEGL